MFRRLAAAAAALLALGGEAPALTLEIVFDESDPARLPGVRRQVCAPAACPPGASAEGGTGGASLIGAPVERRWSSTIGGPPNLDTDRWRDAGGGYGAVFAFVLEDPPAGFLFAEGDVFDGLWTATNLFAGEPILGYAIDALAAGRVFDVAAPSPGTPGSGLGRTFEIDAFDLPLQTPGDRLTVTYSRPVGIGAAPPAGDLWGRMSLDFTGFAAGGLFGRIDFRADVDAAVPLPPAAALLAAGLAALGAAARRRRA